MTTFFIILGIIVVLVFIANSSKSTDSVTVSPKKVISQAGTQTNSSENVPTVAELVNSVKTLDDLRKFEKKEKEIEAKYGEDFENKHCAKLYQRYSDAFSKLCNKILFYQYVPEINTDTPLATLADAYKLYSVDDYKQRKKGTKQDHWEEIGAGQIMGQTLESALEPQPLYLTTLIKFRETVEGNLSSDEKLNVIRDLIEKDVEFKKRFFFVESEAEKLIKRYSKTKQRATNSVMTEQ